MKHQVSMTTPDHNRGARRGQRLNRRLRQELEETERFWASVGHDVSNLLEAVVGNAERLRERLRADAKACRIVDAMMTAGELAGSWVEGPLMVSRERHNGARRASLNGLLRQTESLLPLLVRDVIQVDVQYGSEEVAVNADPVEVVRVILNLVMNARDAMPEGGRLTLRADQVRRDGAAARSSGRSGRRGIFGRIIVCDTGAGIDNAPRVFDLAYSTKPEHRGLGLYSARRLTEANGGFIEFKSEAGRGTAFSVYFPCSSGAPGELAAETIASAPLPLNPAQPIRAASPAAGSRRVLVVEDDPLVRELLCRTIARAGYEVIEAASAEQALDFCVRQALRVDLLVTDVRMERMSGRDLGRTMRAKDPGVRILYVSGCPDENLASAANLSDFLLKPFKPSALLCKVQEMLRMTRPGK